MRELSQQTILQAIQEVRTVYLVKQEVRPGVRMSLFEINNGLCEDFAEDVLAKLRGWGIAESDNLYAVETAGFYKDYETNEDWDSKLLREHWNIKPPSGTTWKKLNAISFGAHIWVVAKVGPGDSWLHFDAECDTGVSSFFELPMFHRYVHDTWPTEEDMKSWPADKVWYPAAA